MLTRFCLIPLRTKIQNYEENFIHLAHRLSEIMQRYQPNIICFPECTLTGYLFEPNLVTKFAETIPGPTTRMVRNLAKKYNVLICFGLIERSDEHIYNTAVLIDQSGKIILKHRKINEQPPFKRGDIVSSVITKFGKIGLLICGDLFAGKVIDELSPNLDYLLLPMSRSFNDLSPDKDRWEMKEKKVYIDAASKTSTTTMIVNSLEIGCEEVSFGGALIVDSKGNLLAESSHGTDNILIWESSI